MRSISEPGRLEDDAVHGDQDALTRLIAKHDAAVRVRLTGEIPKRWQALITVDDVMQETYIDAFLGIGNYTSRGDNAFCAWLTSIAKHNLLNAIKGLERQKRGGDHGRITNAGREESMHALYEMLSGTITAPSRHVAKDEAKTALLAAMGLLPEDYRKVVNMYDLEGIPIEDIARELARSPGAVYMLRARAHDMLSKLLGKPVLYFSDFK